MASAWGNSWGSSWGNSWGTISVEPSVLITGRNTLVFAYEDRGLTLPTSESLVLGFDDRLLVFPKVGAIRLINETRSLSLQPSERVTFAPQVLSFSLSRTKEVLRFTPEDRNLVFITEDRTMIVPNSNRDTML